MSVRHTVHCDGCGIEQPGSPGFDQPPAPGWVHMTGNFDRAHPAQLYLRVNELVSLTFDGQVDFCSVDCMASTMRGWVENALAERAERRLRGSGGTSNFIPVALAASEHKL